MHVFYGIQMNLLFIINEFIDTINHLQKREMTEMKGDIFTFKNTRSHVRVQCSFDFCHWKNRHLCWVLLNIFIQRAKLCTWSRVVPFWVPFCLNCPSLTYNSVTHQAWGDVTVRLRTCWGATFLHMHHLHLSGAQTGFRVGRLQADIF